MEPKRPRPTKHEDRLDRTTEHSYADCVLHRDATSKGMLVP